MTIQTSAGPRRLEFLRRRGELYTFESTMGRPGIRPEEIPVLLPSSAKSLDIQDHPLEVAGHTILVTLTSMGNPHCSTFWPDLDEVPLETLGPLLECHPAFPARTNVEFIQVLGAGRLRVRFWERGVGRTLASGTGSCAAAVAAVRLNRVQSPIEVVTDLGSLFVAWTPPGEVYLTGEAELVCTGTWIPGVIETG